MKPLDLSRRVADRIWRERAGIAWKDDERIADRPEEEPATLHFQDGSSVRISTAPWRVKIEMGGHVATLEYGHASPIVEAWRAVRAEGMLRAMGDGVDVEALAVEPVGAMSRMAARFGAKPVRRLSNVIRRLDETIARRVRNDETQAQPASYDDCDYDGNRVRRKALWRGVGGGVRFVGRTRQTLDGALRHLVADHPDWGMIEIDAPLTTKAMSDVRARTFDALLDGARPLPSPALPPTGNARVARIVTLCRTALEIDPELADSNGAAIAPLVDRHLPELLRTHAEASRTAPAGDLAKVDEALDRGVETVRHALLDAIQGLHERRMRDLTVQLRFLELRHPDASAPIPGPVDT